MEYRNEPRAWIDVSKEAIRHNLLSFREHLPHHVKLMAVVKGNAYGHGAVDISLIALANGADALGVAIFDEAHQLRRAGITAPLLVMGYTPSEAYETAIREDIQLTIFHEQDLKKVSAVASAMRQYAKIHLKYDTGMGRIGVVDEAEMQRLTELTQKSPFIIWAGLFTHYACADGDNDADRMYTKQQYDKLNRLAKICPNNTTCSPLIHAGNSAAAIMHPQYCGDMVRIGISLYGMYPSSDAAYFGVRLQPALTLKSRITQFRDEGCAVVPIGYSDGLIKKLERRACVLIQGKRLSWVHIGAHHSLVSTKGLSTPAISDEVVIIGEQGKECIMADDLAGLLGTINYEITSKLSAFLPRRYLEPVLCDNNR